MLCSLRGRIGEEASPPAHRRELERKQALQEQVDLKLVLDARLQESSRDVLASSGVITLDANWASCVHGGVACIAAKLNIIYQTIKRDR